MRGLGPDGFHDVRTHSRDLHALDMDTRPRAGASDDFLRQGNDPDGLAAELAPPEQRRRDDESTFSEAARSEPARIARNPEVETLTLFGPSDHVRYPEFDEMAAVTFPHHVGPFLVRDCGPSPHRSVHSPLSRNGQRGAASSG